MAAEASPARPGEGWRPGPRRLHLPEGEVQVWRLGVPAAAEQLAGSLSAVPAAERRRAAGFSGEGPRARYLAGRVLLRLVLGRLTGVEPAALPFARGDNGKPRLALARALEFNLAHSGGLALLAVARGRRVGVDVERLRPRLDVLGVARLALAPAELAELAALADPAARRAAFFRCWTRKEAYLKGRADGLPGRLRQWSVPVGGEEVVAPSAPGDPDRGRRWRIRSLTLGPDYAGAVAYEGDLGLGLRCFDLAALSGSAPGAAAPGRAAPAPRW